MTGNAQTRLNSVIDKPKLAYPSHKAMPKVYLIWPNPSRLLRLLLGVVVRAPNFEPEPLPAGWAVADWECVYALCISKKYRSGILATPYVYPNNALVVIILVVP